MRHLHRRLALLVTAALVPACAAGDPDDPADEAVSGEDSQDVATTAGDAERADLRVVLSPRQAAYRAGEPVLVDVTITNVSQRHVKLLSWMLPAPDLEEPVFSVSLGGQRVAFVGPHYKRPHAGSGDFVNLRAGDSLTRQVDLAGFYDLSRTGDYDLRLEVASGDLRPDDAAAASMVVSNMARVWVEGRTVASEPVTLAAVTGSLAFSRCTTSQQDLVTQAVATANAMSDGASSYLAATTPGATSRYTTWFGAFSSAGWSTASSHFVSIADAFDTKAITVDCGCKKTYYAYVYPTKPYMIYVCKAFWSAPLSGTDSKGGTLIHEMSHFNVVAATDDWAYGQTAAKSLAISDAQKALDNADSHEYFAENTPALP